jgi:predicted deacylase
MSATTRKDTRFITAQYAHGAEVTLPVGTVHGATEGPTACFIAGVHGAEYVGMEALRRVFRQLDPPEVTGEIRFVFIANLPAFHARSEAVTPLDGKNLNRVFPGKTRGGTYSEFLASVIFEHTMLGSDFVVDLHGGDIFEALAPYIGLRHDSADAVSAQSRRLADAYGVEFVLTMMGLPGQAKGGLPLTGAAVQAGIPAILAEAGGEGILQEEFVDVHTRGVLNVLREWGMVKGRPEIPVPPRHMYSYFWPSEATGVFYPRVKYGDWVKAGQKVGEVWDYFGTRQLQEIRAPYDAAIIAVVTTPATQEGAIVFQVATDREQPG